MISQILLVVLMIAVLALYFYSDHKIFQLQRQYKNDERWHQIRLQANVIIKKYYEWLVLIASVVTIVSTFSQHQILIRLDTVSTLIVFIILIGHVVEYFSIQRLDKFM